MLLIPQIWIPTASYKNFLHFSLILLFQFCVDIIEGEDPAASYLNYYAASNWLLSSL